MEQIDHGKYVVEFPEDMDKEKVIRMKEYIIRYFERHGCRVGFRSENTSMEVIHEQNNDT